MLHMPTDSAMAATVALLVIKLEGTTFVLVKILYYLGYLALSVTNSLVLTSNYDIFVQLCMHIPKLY